MGRKKRENPNIIYERHDNSDGDVYLDKAFDILFEEIFKDITISSIKNGFDKKPYKKLYRRVETHVTF